MATYTQKTISAKSKKRIILGSSVFAGLVIIATTIFSNLVIVDATEVAVYTNWGNYEENWQSGVHFKDIFGGKAYIYDTRVQEIELSYTAYTADTQIVDYIVSVHYQLNKANVKNVFDEYGTMEQLKSKMIPTIKARVENNIKSYSSSKTVAGQDVNEVIQNRDIIEETIFTALKNECNKFYVDISRVKFSDISFSTEYEKAVEAKQVAYQNYLAEQNKAKATIEKAKGEAEAMIETAKGEAGANMALAESEAKITELLATAESAAREIILKSWETAKASGVEENLLRQIFIDKWDGVLPTFVTGDDALSIIFGLPQANNP